MGINNPRWEEAGNGVQTSPMAGWNPPTGWTRVRTIDAHTAGEPLRIIFDGFPDLPGASMVDRRRYAREHYDYLRKALMWEPRGHADMYGCVITKPATSGSDFGVLFLHNEGFSTMCGHGIIAVSKVAVETGLVEMKEPETAIRIDSPAGLITSYVRVDRGQVLSIRFHNVPSFALALDQTIDVPGLGSVTYDLAFGGAFYAYVEAEQLGLKCIPEEYSELIDRGMAIKHTIMAARPVRHPFESELSFLYGTIFVASPRSKGADVRNVCVFAEGEVDRSPTGTGVSGLMALRFARKRLGLNEPIVVESIIGSSFVGRAVSRTTFGDYEAVVPEVEGSAYITGKNEFIIDPDDPLRYGFILR